MRFSPTQYKIIRYLASFPENNGHITRIEATEILGISLEKYLDAMAELTYQNIIGCTQIEINPSPGYSCMVNKYMLTGTGKQLLKRMKLKPYKPKAHV